MLQKIRDLMQVQEEISKINEKLGTTVNSVNSLSAQVASLAETIQSKASELSQKNIEFYKNFNENINSMKKIRDSLEEELFEFKLFKTQTQQKMMQKFEEELGKELKINLESLKADAEKYNELKGQINSISFKVNDLSDEIGKFLNISRHIKEKDFEMNRFARDLLAMDKEKLELMRKVDTLQRLVGRMRRAV
ncbi:hypothetical protein J4212_08200 [Candidatus Woesearchaeota archaeon]|nr:hypothetical protein [Candidatus Woesearchaeota archaeon]